MSPRRRQRAAEARVTTGDQVGARLPADLEPHLEAVRPPEHEHAIQIRGTGRMMVDLAARAIVGALLTAAAFTLFVLAVLLDWPGAAIFWIFVLGWVMALTVGRRPSRAIRAWRYVRRTPWRYYDAKVSPGTMGRLIELQTDDEEDLLHMRVYADKRATELLKWSAAYSRVWFAGSVTGRGIVVPAGGGIPIPVRRVVLLTAGGTTLARYARYGLPEWRLKRRRQAAARAAFRAQQHQARALAMMNKADARRAARLRKHPPKPGKVLEKPAKVLKQPAKPIPTRTPKPPRQGWGRGRDLSQFLPEDK